MTVAYLACMVAVAQFHHLPPRVLPAIQAVEAGRPGVVSRNRNGSGDLGVMQVNSRWVPHLAASWRMPHAVVAERLIGDPCFNVAAAGAIMRIYLTEARGDVVRAVGYYHSHTPERASVYQMKVIRASVSLFGWPKPVKARGKAKVRKVRAPP